MTSWGDEIRRAGSVGVRSAMVDFFALFMLPKFFVSDVEPEVGKIRSDQKKVLASWSIGCASLAIAKTCSYGVD